MSFLFRSLKLKILDDLEGIEYTIKKMAETIERLWPNHLLPPRKRKCCS